jgi:hypothetical protein
MLSIIRFKVRIKKHVAAHNKFKSVWDAVKNKNRSITSINALLPFLKNGTMSTASVRQKTNNKWCNTSEKQFVTKLGILSDRFIWMDSECFCLNESNVSASVAF